MIYERKAFIEFIEADKIRVTTPFRQKEFNLKDVMYDELSIDLINLKTSDNQKMPFYGIVEEIDDNNMERYNIEIYANGNQKIEDVDFYDRQKLVKAKILEND